MKKDIVADQINHRETKYVPYTLKLEDAVAEMLTKHFGSEDWKKQIKNYIVRMGTFDSWNTMIYPTPEKGIDAYGSEWTITKYITHLDVPALSKTPYLEYQLPALDKFIDEKKRREMIDICEKNSDSYLVADVGAGVYELSWRLMGVEELLMNFALEPDYINELFGRLAVQIQEFIKEAVKLPVEAVIISDDWADQRGLIMGAERWRKYIKPHLAGFYKQIHKAGKKTITHVCGSVEEIIPDLIEIGLDVLESVQPEAANMNPYELKKKYGNDIAFWGGLGCQSIVNFGTPRELKDEIRKLRHEMSKNGGYILAPSKTINESVPLDNALAIYETFIEEDCLIND